MRKKTNILIILSIFFIIIIGCTYAYSRYTGAAHLPGAVGVASWSIKVNECNIINPKDNDPLISSECFETKTITDEKENQIIEIVKNFRVTEEYITYYPLENDKQVGVDRIAPGTEARFNIKIDPTITQAAFKYTLKASYPAENIKFYIVECTLEENADGEKVYTPKTDESGGEKTIPLTADGYVNYIYFTENIGENIQYLQVKVVWENDDTGNSDKSDTQIGTAGTQPTLSIPVSIEFEQITSDADTNTTSEPIVSEPSTN